MHYTKRELVNKFGPCARLFISVATPLRARHYNVATFVFIRRLCIVRNSWYSDSNVDVKNWINFRYHYLRNVSWPHVFKCETTMLLDSFVYNSIERLVRFANYNMYTHMDMINRQQRKVIIFYVSS